MEWRINGWCCEKPAGRRDDGARHHQFSAGALGRLAARLAFLVNLDRAALLHDQINVAALQGAALLLGEGGQRLLVICQRPDFLTARRGEIILVG